MPSGLIPQPLNGIIEAKSKELKHGRQECRAVFPYSIDDVARQVEDQISPPGAAGVRGVARLQGVHALGLL